MGLRDTLNNLSAIIGAQGSENGLLEPLLASQGIDAALLEYDPDSRQVILALLIHGQTRYVTLATGRRYDRRQIAELIAGKTPAAIAPGPGSVGQHVSRQAAEPHRPQPSGEIQPIQEPQPPPIGS